MQNIVNIIKRKPMFFLLISLGYLLIVGFFKWNIHPSWQAIYFFCGGLLGVYFLDVAEEFFKLSPSPFRSVVFVVGFIVVSFFVITSSGSLLSSGLVLSLYLTLLLWQIGEWQIKRNLNDWYRLIAGAVNEKTQLWILIGCMLVFCIETYLFIR